MSQYAVKEFAYQYSEENQYGNPVYASNVRDSTASSGYNSGYNARSTNYENHGSYQNDYQMDVVKLGDRATHNTNSTHYQSHLTHGGIRTSHANHSFAVHEPSQRESRVYHEHHTSNRHSNTHFGESKVVAVNHGEPKVLETRQGRNSVVLGQREIGSKIVAEHYNTRIIGEHLNHLPERVVDNRPAPRKSVRRTV